MTVEPLIDCLPASLRGPTTTITRVTAGLSGAGVYRVDAGGRRYILKVSRADEPVEGWQRRLEILSNAADAGVAPRVVHTDRSHRAIVSEFVVDRVFPALYGDPRTRPAAIALLGRLLRDVHSLPIPGGAMPGDPRQFIQATWSALGTDFQLPSFVTDTVQQLLADAAPPIERSLVLSHNDANPSNLIYDGEKLLMVDWDAAGPNDPLYDLATVALFLRMDDEGCRALLTAYDGAPASHVPARFTYDRRLVGAMCGLLFLQLAQRQGCPGATGRETLESTESLGDLYQRMRTGSVDIATADGQWSFGLTLVGEAARL